MFSPKGIAKKITSTARMDNTPINLFGNTRNRLNVGKKYHSGRITEGVANGLAGLPKPRGS